MSSRVHPKADNLRQGKTIWRLVSPGPEIQTEPWPVRMNFAVQRVFIAKTLFKKVDVETFESSIKKIDRPVSMGREVKSMPLECDISDLPQLGYMRTRRISTQIYQCSQSIRTETKQRLIIVDQDGVEIDVEKERGRLFVSRAKAERKVRRFFFLLDEYHTLPLSSIFGGQMRLWNYPSFAAISPTYSLRIRNQTNPGGHFMRKTITDPINNAQKDRKKSPRQTKQQAW